MTLLTNPKAKEAFDLTREDPAVRDRYGRNAWGQQLLMCRRLVEAGVDIVTSQLSGPLCGRVGNWDDHAVNHNVFEAMKFRANAWDQAVTALIEDLYERGLDKRVLLCVTGEFGRTLASNTPRAPVVAMRVPQPGPSNPAATTGRRSPTSGPGRDPHWAVHRGHRCPWRRCGRTDVWSWGLPRDYLSPPRHRRPQHAHQGLLRPPDTGG